MLVVRSSSGCQAVSFWASWPGAAAAGRVCGRLSLPARSRGFRARLHLPQSERSPCPPTGRLAPDPMASEAPSPSLSPSPPTSPESELAQLRRKVEKLEHELRSCKRQVREIEKLLHHTERLYQSAESNNQELRTQVRGPPARSPAPHPALDEAFGASDSIGRAPWQGPRTTLQFIEYLKEINVQCDYNSKYIWSTPESSGYSS